MSDEYKSIREIYTERMFGSVNEQKLSFFDLTDDQQNEINKVLNALSVIVDNRSTEISADKDGIKFEAKFKRGVAMSMSSFKVLSSLKTILGIFIDKDTLIIDLKTR